MLHGAWYSYLMVGIMVNSPDMTSLVPLAVSSMLCLVNLLVQYVSLCLAGEPKENLHPWWTIKVGRSVGRSNLKTTTKVNKLLNEKGAERKTKSYNIKSMVI